MTAWLLSCMQVESEANHVWFRTYTSPTINMTNVNITCIHNGTMDDKASGKTVAPMVPSAACKHRCRWWFGLPKAVSCMRKSWCVSVQLPDASMRWS